MRRLAVFALSFIAVALAFAAPARAEQPADTATRVACELPTGAPAAVDCGTKTPPVPAVPPTLPTATSDDAPVDLTVPAVTPDVAVTTEVPTSTAPAAAPRAIRPATHVVRVGPVSVATPPAWLVLTLVAAAAVAVSLRAGRRTPRLSGPPASIAARPLGWGVTAAALCALPSLLSETTVYKLGLVLIVLVAAVGLHLLVNWAGELSLAHAALVGLPAFAVAKISSDFGVSPILLLPVGVAIGLAAGAVIGLPAIRARGLQVALVTLAGGVAIDRFFFTKEWLVGTVSSPAVAKPSIGPWTFDSSKSLYAVLAVVVVATIAVAYWIYRSKLGRAFLWIKAQPDAAEAFGIPVARYRALAYALAGGFAGLGGGLTTMWVQRLTPEAFPLSRSFTFLIIVALAGRGFVGGVVAAAAVVEGGQLFLADGGAFITYAAPLGLLFTLTKHPTGLNGLGRGLAARIRTLLDGRKPVMTPRLALRPLLTLGMIIVAIGFASIGLAWYHCGNTSQVWIQNQEMVLGGLGGLALVIVGTGVVVYDRLLAARAVEVERWERVLAAFEQQSSAAPTRSRRLAARAS